MAGVAGPDTSQLGGERADSIHFGRELALAGATFREPSLRQYAYIWVPVEFAFGGDDREEGLYGAERGPPPDLALHHGGSPARLCTRARVQQTYCAQGMIGASMAESGFAGVERRERGGWLGGVFKLDGVIRGQGAICFP
jgi:hypothetical protein